MKNAATEICAHIRAFCQINVDLVNEQSRLTRLGGVMVGASTPSLGGRWFKPRPSLPKDLKMVRAASFLDAQHLKG